MSDEVIWITRDPNPALEGRDLEITFTSKVRQCTYRMEPGRARKLASDILFVLDEAERKPSNVRPFKKR